MKRLHWVLCAIVIGICGPAWADGGGTVYREGAATKFLSAYAYAKPDLFDESKQAVVIYVLDGPIDAATFDAAPDREGALGHLLWDTNGNTVQLTIGPDKNGQAGVEQVNLVARVNGTTTSTSASMGPDYYVLDLKANDGKRIEGSLRSTHESEKTAKNGSFFDLHFALNVASGPPFGPGLPPDGGAPFKGYWKYVSALWSATTREELDDEKVQALANTLSDARIKAMNQIAESAGKGKGELDKAQLAVLKKMWANVPHGDRSVNSNDVVFVSGRMNGDVATMEIKGERSQGTIDGNGNYTPGPPILVTVTMKKENGEWCFDKDQKHEIGRGKASPAAPPGNASPGTQKN